MTIIVMALANVVMRILWESVFSWWWRYHNWWWFSWWWWFGDDVDDVGDDDQDDNDIDDDERNKTLIDSQPHEAAPLESRALGLISTSDWDWDDEDGGDDHDDDYDRDGHEWNRYKRSIPCGKSTRLYVLELVFLVQKRSQSEVNHNSPFKIVSNITGCTSTTAVWSISFFQGQLLREHVHFGIFLALISYLVIFIYAKE